MTHLPEALRDVVNTDNGPFGYVIDVSTLLKGKLHTRLTPRDGIATTTSNICMDTNRQIEQSGRLRKLAPQGKVRTLEKVD